MAYSFINANIDLGTHVCGSELGPKLITKNFEEYNIVNVDKENVLKDFDKANKTKNLPAINNFNKSLYNEVSKIIDNNDFPITVGGDHSLAVASALASRKKNDDIGIIWIDAHTDYNTIETTITGNVHGFPLAGINGHNKKELSEFLDSNVNYIAHEKTVIIGARSIDQREMDNLKEDNITIFSIEDLREKGISNVMDEAFKIAIAGNTKIHVSYDLDVFDPKVASGVSIPEKDGITEQEGYQIMRYISDNKDYLASLDLVEYNPKYDKDNKTLNIAINLLKLFLNH